MTEKPSECPECGSKDIGEDKSFETSDPNVKAVKKYYCKNCFHDISKQKLLKD